MAFIIASATLTLDGDAFSGEVSGATFTPSKTDASFTAINGVTQNFSSPATWVLDLGFAQEFDADALARYLHENEGDVVAAVLTPHDGSPTATANVTLSPGAIGGEAAAVAASTVSLASTKPVLSAAV